MEYMYFYGSLINYQSHVHKLCYLLGLGINKDVLIHKLTNCGFNFGSLQGLF